MSFLNSTPNSCHQYRLDFDNFDVDVKTTPDADDGTCIDSFDVTTGSSRNYRTLCGTGNGQHIYLETGRATTSQTLTFTIASGSTGSTWKAKVSQIGCYEAWRAPSDCYQYFTGLSGRVQSFNYGSEMVRNQQYAACVRKETGYCGINWKATQGLPSTPTTDSFDLGGTGALSVSLKLIFKYNFT